MAKKLLLIGWDAADWRILHPLIDAGKMPALRQLVEGGASGALLSGRPILPAPQWTSLVTGKRPWQHGVCHQFDSDPATGRPVPVTARHRQCAALWDMLAREGLRSIWVGWPGTHGLRCERATLVSNRYAEPTAGPGVTPWPPALAGSYWPEKLGANLDAFRVSPEAIQADMISRFVPDWQKVDQKRDVRLSHLRIFLATDLSFHAALKHLLRVQDWNLAAVQFPALGPISAMFLHCHPPRREGLVEAEFELFQHVVTAACVTLDQMLTNLIQSAGKDVAVVVASAHGINPNAPLPSGRGGEKDLWKSPNGIFAAAGPGFSPDSLVVGATIQDVAPTLLNWFGLPIGDDMEGRVLMEAFATTPEVLRRESWDDSYRPELSTTQKASAENLPFTATDSLALESAWNRAQSCLDASRYEAALPILSALFRAFPERADFALALFHCQLTLKQTDAAAETIEVLLEVLPPGIWALLAQTELLLAKGEREEARRLAEEIRGLQPAHPEAMRRLGMIWWRLRDWTSLGEIARQALRVNDAEPLAWLGLAESALRLRQPEEALDAATRAISLNYFLAQAHLALARACLALGKWAEARSSMQTVLLMQPNNRAAAAYLQRTGLGDAPPASGD
jgi:predicted AlkP superfamily phosphohydrolase/phosphomutase